MAQEDGTVAEEDEEPDDLDASGKIEIVKDLRRAVDALRDKEEITIHNACKRLAQELDYTAHTLVNYYHTKPNDYSLGWDDPEADPAEQSDDSNAAANPDSEVNGSQAATHNSRAEGSNGSEGYVTMNKLLNLRAHNPQIVDLAQQGKLKLFFTAISDVEDRSGAAMEVATRLLMDGALSDYLLFDTR